MESRAAAEQEQFRRRKGKGGPKGIQENNNNNVNARAILFFSNNARQKSNLYKWAEFYFNGGKNLERREMPNKSKVG